MSETRVVRPRSFIDLPPPKDESTVSLFSALAQRRTIRQMTPAPLEDQRLSNLLWSAFGVNRREGPFGLPGRTAGSASNSQEIQIYVALQAGAYLYDALSHRLNLVTGDDVRALTLTPGQNLAVEAAAALIYVADVDRLAHSEGFQEPGLRDREVQKSYYWFDAGLVAQNVYLFAAANALAAWLHNCDRAALAQALRLSHSQRVLFAHSIARPSCP